MPVFALLIDALTLGGYYLQLNHPGSFIYLIGFIFQLVMTLLLFFLTVGYHGKRYAGFRPEGYSYLSIRFGLIVVSLLINGIVLFLYGLNLFGINDLVFSGY
ncbi:hypothetical protein NRIC_11570 [Enterococcus florum]|uniref:Uncharacterized protein n=1 Tax=Enterococcus florum TaxID=2480627 RepID=A0A4P5P747_9ENTE|nr:hypothetical protein [Enterococcus florum]GCF93266.1 hypothetical protein NRIC_11570 [Enterococcus florum]